MREKIELQDVDDMKLIFYVQDINRPGADKRYTKDFMEAVHNEVLRRGENPQEDIKEEMKNE